MEMPLIPALTGQATDDEAAATPSVEELIAALSDDEVAQLDQEAADWAASGQEGAEAAPNEEVGETEDPAEEADEGEEATDGGDEATDMNGSPREMLEATRQAKYAIDDTVSELTTLLEQASQHEKAGMDVDAVQTQLETAQEAQEQADDLLEQASDAVDGEDPQAAAKAASDAQKLQAKVEAALETAKGLVGSSAKAAMETAVPDEVLAFDGWAKKLLGTK